MGQVTRPADGSGHIVPDAAASRDHRSRGPSGVGSLLGGKGGGVAINTGATVDHDCHLDDAVHVSPGANISGGVTINKYAWLGIGSAVVEGVTIAENTQTGAGAVVTKDTQQNSLYVGVPAKRIRTLT